MIRSIIVAVAENGVIGKDNDLIWHLPRDLRFFQKTTTGHCMLMGRKTLEALGKPLKNRHHIVISRNFEFNHEQVSICSSVEKGIALAEEMSETELFISGGGTIYKYCLDHNLVDKVYLTRINSSFDGDTYFPDLELAEWNESSRQDFDADDKNKHAMSFIVYKRRN